MGELFRWLNRLTLTLDRVERKVDKRPTQEELDRRDGIRDRADAARDTSIKALENQLDAEVKALAGRMDTATGWIIASLATALLGVLLQPVMRLLGGA